MIIYYKDNLQYNLLYRTSTHPPHPSISAADPRPVKRRAAWVTRRGRGRRVAMGRHVMRGDTTWRRVARGDATGWRDGGDATVVTRRWWRDGGDATVVTRRWWRGEGDATRATRDEGRREKARATQWERGQGRRDEGQRVRKGWRSANEKKKKKKKKKRTACASRSWVEEGRGGRAWKRRTTPLRVCQREGGPMYLLRKEKRLAGTRKKKKNAHASLLSAERWVAEWGLCTV